MVKINNDKIHLITNNHKYELLYFDELSPKWQKIAKRDYDWIDDSDTTSWENEQFFVYRRNLYSLSDFERVDKNDLNFMQGWDGHLEYTYFSGVLIKFPKEDWGNFDSENLIVATFYS